MYHKSFPSIPKLSSIENALKSANLQSMKLKLLCDDETKTSQADKTIRNDTLKSILLETNFIANVINKSQAQVPTSIDETVDLGGTDVPSSVSLLTTTNTQLVTVTFFTMKSGTFRDTLL